MTMRRPRRVRAAIGAVAIVTLASGCQPKPTYREPPAGTYTAAKLDVRVGEATFSVQGARVTPDFFAATGARPLLGRSFVEADAGPNASSVAVLSQDFWRERFESSPAIIGKAIEVDGRQRTVVGVAPPGFDFPAGAQLWVLQR
jgi:putative ABC transport system permease protein